MFGDACCATAYSVPAPPDGKIPDDPGRNIAPIACRNNAAGCDAAEMTYAGVCCAMSRA
jgi:hypothetical protein